MSTAERIYDEIERRIRGGDWSPGTRIPFEHELVSTYRCARATANKALSRLAREGLIERRRKAGSFVASPQIRSAILSVPDIGALITARGEDYRWALLNRKIGSPPPDADAGSGDDSWLALTGVHHAGALPFGFEARWINIASVPPAEDVDFAGQAPGSWLLSHVPWTDARHRVRAVSAEAPIAEALDISETASCLQVERWTWRSGARVTYVRQTFPGDRYDLVDEFTPRS